MAGRRSVEVVFLADDSKLQSVLTQVHAGATAAAGSVEHVGSAASHSGIQGREAFSTFNDALRATGQGLGPLGEAFDHLSILMDHVAEHSGNVRRQLAGVGLGITALAGIAFAAGQQDATAMAGLKSAVEATGRSFEEYAPRLEQAAQSQARFGHTAADATKALDILTTASRDPIKAMHDLHLVGEIAAKTNTSEAASAQLVANMYAGNFKVLRQFGIGKKDLVDVTKELTKAEGDQAAAANLQAVQERSVQLNARIAAAEQHRVEVAQAAVASAQASDSAAAQNVENARASLDSRRQAAQQADTDAAQHASDLKAALDQKRADARQADTDAERNLSDLRQQIADSNAAAEQGYADRVATATQGVVDAKTRLEELEARIAQREAGTIADKYSLLAAEEAVQRAKRNIADGQAKGTGGLDALQNAEQHLAELREQGVLRAKASLSEDQSLGHARESVGKSTDGLNKVTEAGSGVAGRHTAQQHAMRTATEAAAKAHQHLTEVMSASGLEQQALDKAIRQAVKAHEASIAAMDSNGLAAQGLNRAVLAAAAAHERLAKAQASAASAGKATLGEQQQQQKMAEEIAKAIKRQQAAGAEMAKAKADEAARGSQIAQAMAMLEQRLGDVAEQKAKTTAGRLKGYLAEMENWVAGFGQKYGGAVMAFGVGLTVLSSLAETKVAKMLGSSLAGVAGWAGGIITKVWIVVAQYAKATAKMIAQAARWAARMLVSGAEAMLPFLPIILIVAAVGIAAYELYKHWDQVWGFIKDVTSTAWRWIKQHLDMIMNAAIAPLRNEISFLRGVWGAVWNAIGSATSSAAGWIQGSLNWITGAFGGIGGSLNWIRGVFSDVWGSLGGIVRGGANEVIQGINFMIDALNAIQVHIPSINLGPLGSTGSLDWGGMNLSHVPYLAAGSPFFGGGLAVVGERGPEMVRLPTGAQVYPNGKGPAGMGGGGDVHVHIHAEGAYIMDRAGFLRDITGPLADSLTAVFRDRERYGSHLLAGSR